ncbi:hypothetical protein HDU93_007120, partial [Gonapodya sp. JEL0774]
ALSQVSASGVVTMRSIFDFPKGQYPLLNESIATVYNFSGNDLSVPFPDTSWLRDGYMIHVTTQTFFDYRYIIVAAV